MPETLKAAQAAPSQAPDAGEATPVPGTPDNLARRVIAWQRRHGRHDLPWQGTRDPYRVWLSEVMLQQTQVATVLPYYAAFLARFPDVAALAAAPLDDVLARWSGLGYYSRARNLHRCAQRVMERHGGVFPGDSATLATLPGIGRSTAAAIAAFCFGERAAILDGNVKRVLTRVLGFGHDLAQARHERMLWQQAQALLPDTGVEAYTQGLMDLGAGVCTRSRPRCEACPLRDGCQARALGRPQDFPVKTRTLRRSQRRSVLLWLQQGERLWLVQRPPRGVWASLWSLPEGPADEALGAPWTQWPGQGEPLPTVQHALTHFDWTLQPVRWTLPPRTAAARREAIEADVLAWMAASPADAGQWLTRGEALALGLPAPVRRLLEG